ncbi:MAG TPA: helix-turn-helix domain-containing protein [Cytophagales bacterium]|nr:helix-turn-helix domain-containing protein [Cytophagales bacterium]
MRKTTSSNYINEERILASCGMAYTLSLIGGRWKPAILWQLLLNGRIRYNQLKKGLPDISERVLVSNLRELETHLLVSRIVHPEVPPRVEYELTELGQSMKPMLETISSWGNMHRELAETEHSVQI